MTRLWCFAAALVLALSLGCSPSLSQAPAAAADPTPVQQLGQAQFDALVDAISKAVVKKLKDDGTATALRAAPSAAPAVVEEGVAEAAETDSIRFFERAGQVALSAPAFLSALVHIPQALSPPEGGDKPLGRFLLYLCAAVAIALGAEFIVRMMLAPLRRRLASGIDHGGGLTSLILIALLDLAALATVWIAVHGLAAAWFSGETNQSRFASLVLTAIFSWRLYMFAFRLCFRPVLPLARLAEISDTDARAIYAGVGGTIIVILFVRIVMRFLLATDVPLDAIACGQVVTAVLLVAIFVGVSVSLRRPVADWLRGLSPMAEPGPFVTSVSRNWLAFAIPFFVILGAAQIHGALAGRVTVGAALILTLNVVIGLLLIETAIDRVRRFQVAHKVSSGDERPRVADAVARCARVAILVGAAGLIAEIWLFEVLGIVDSSRFAALVATATTVGGTIFVAYCAWEAVKFVTARYVVRHTPGVGHHSDSEDDVAPTSTSRVATLMPLLRVALMVVIVVLAVLTVLSQFGVNITALIAGASVVRSRRLVRQPDARQGYRLRRVLPGRRRLPGRRIHRLRQGQGNRRRLHAAVLAAAPPERPGPHDPVRPARPDHQFQPRLDDDEIQPSLRARHRPREAAQDREENRPGHARGSGVEGRDPRAAQDAGCRRTSPTTPWSCGSSSR